MGKGPEVCVGGGKGWKGVYREVKEVSVNLLGCFKLFSFERSGKVKWVRVCAVIACVDLEEIGMLGGLIRGCGLGGLGRRVVDWKRHITYEVRVFTGNQRGAGTSSNVFVSLQGSRDHTDQQYLYGGRFERASVEKFVIEAPFDIGEIRSVVVGTDETGPTGGWYLDKVEINGQAFPCKKWFGKDAYGKTGPLSQVLTPNEENSLNSQALRSTMPSAKEFRLLTAADVIPHPEKQKLEKSRLCTEDFGWAGEDSYFCFSKGRKNLSIGVADGVHQWREKGIDAGEYSRELMKFAEDYIIEVKHKHTHTRTHTHKPVRLQMSKTPTTCPLCNQPHPHPPIQHLCSFFFRCLLPVGFHSLDCAIRSMARKCSGQ